MAKVTSKLQVTIPKALAQRYGIEPGADIRWEAAGNAIRIAPAAADEAQADPTERLRRFDQSTERRDRRQRAASKGVRARSRGWTREDLYDRARAR